MQTGRGVCAFRRKNTGESLHDVQHSQYGEGLCLVIINVVYWILSSVTGVRVVRYF
jgi:hypothetical protein